jgi:hypothetical protein
MVVSPPNVDTLPFPAYVDSWAPGDTFQVIQPTKINIWKLDPLFVELKFDPSFQQVLAAVRAYHCDVFSPQGLFSDDVYVGRYTHFIECWLERGLNGITGNVQDTLALNINSVFAGSSFRPNQGNSIYYGGAIDFGEVSTELALYDGGVLLNWIPLGNVQGRTRFGDVCLTTGTTVPIGGYCDVIPIAFSTNIGIVWGPGAISLQGTGAGLSYQAPAGGSGSAASIVAGAGPDQNVTGLVGVPGGAAASITAITGPLVTLTGLTGMSPEMVGRNLTVSGAATPANNGTFVVAAYISATSVQVTNAAGVAPDGNNGAIHWTPLQQVVISNAASPANNGVFAVVAFLSATSVAISNGSAVVPDAHNGTLHWTIGSLLFTGGMDINGNTSASAYNDTTGTWSANRAITAANLDTTIAGGGFANAGGGESSSAISPLTSCVITSVIARTDI